MNKLLNLLMQKTKELAAATTEEEKDNIEAEIEQLEYELEEEENAKYGNFDDE